MADNPYVNKVEYGGNTLIDLTGDTVNEGALLQGMTAHSKSGALITGIASSTPTSLYAPVGTIIAFMGTTAPRDYLACDGAVYNIADYSQLANHITSQFGSVSFFGGDGETTFAVPDLRGEFLRGAGTNSHDGQGSGESAGVHQNGTIHTGHYLRNNGDRVYGIAGSDDLDSADTVNSVANYKDYSYISKGVIDAYGAYNPNLFMTEYGPYTSRPTNTSVLYCIAYRDSIPPVRYSTEEQVIGTWIDGKPLYQRTLTDLWTGTRNFSKGSEFVILSDASFIDKLVNSYVNCTANANGSYDSNAGCIFLVRTDRSNGTNTNLYLNTMAGYNGVSDAVVTIQYTKVEDSATT